MKSNNKATKNGGKNNMTKLDKGPKNDSVSLGKAPKAVRLHETRNDLPEKVRGPVCQILNQTLAESLDLMTQTKQAHWNVKGVHFYQLHLLFDEIASELAEYVDEFAERITSLGGTAFGTIRMASRASTLPDYPTDITEGMDHVVELSARFARYAHGLRECIDSTGELGDADTQDLYTGISRNIDKRLWFLEAHLQAPSADRETRHAHVAARPKR
jgi:starvation-inducible DNA-binding protein